jgi:CubicO group peptidase (beta-lactamase class C family)
MNKITFAILPLFSMVMVFSSCGEKDLGSPVTEVDSVIIDSLLSDYDLGDGPGAAVMIIKEGVILFSNGYGLANLENEIPITNETNFRLASITKQFTAMCIMILINHGELDFETTLVEIFPPFPSYGNNITIRYLLNHTSGLVDYESLIQNDATEQVSDMDVYNMMTGLDSTYFTSGTDYRYSNTGYALLAMIVEEKSGLTFSEFLKENIFSPLEMNNSVAHQEGISNITNRAYGYSQEDDGYNLDDQSLTSAVLGDGGIYTSLNDMFRWDQSLYVDTLIPYEILNEAFTSGELSSGEKTGYGFGWRMDTYLYRNRAHHTGSTRGFRNVFMRFPDQKISILILTNRNSGRPINIAEKIADYLFDA